MQRTFSLLTLRPVARGLAPSCALAAAFLIGLTVGPATDATAADAKTPPASKAAKRIAGELDASMQADNATALSAPLSFPKGNGLRILMTGHSWVAPGRITLPEIAKAAGFTGHVQRSHTSGGASGSANSIWLNEHAQDTKRPTRVILLPAISTGKWDVMTWGMYTGDSPGNYTQWMDLCLKSNPAMIFYLQDGWPTPRMNSAGAPPEKLVDSLARSYAQTIVPMFQPNFAALNRDYPGKVHLIPAGAAVVAMLRHFAAGELPGFDCVAEGNGGQRGIYSPDSFHLSRTSGIGWLVGYCYYGVLYKKSPELVTGLSPAGVDPTVDRLMRRAAWHAITQSEFTGLTDANGNGVADETEK